MRQFEDTHRPLGGASRRCGRNTDWNGASWWDGRKKTSVSAGHQAGRAAARGADVITKGCVGVHSHKKRTNAIGPVERTVSQRQPRAYRGRRREPRTDGTVDLSLWCRSEGKGSGGKARGIQPRALRLGHWSALRSVPTVALSSVQSNPILTSKMHRARRPRKKNRREALDTKYSFRDGCLSSLPP